MLVSFVIPCYHSEKTIGTVVDEIDEKMKTMPEYTYEIIMVNDGVPNECWQEISRLCRETGGGQKSGSSRKGDWKPEAGGRDDVSAERNGRRFGICLSRNFGQHAALMAGLHAAKGDRIVCLDDDGQTPASEVDRLLTRIEAGADVVYAKYENKQHSAFRNWGSSVNEAMLHSMLGKPKDLYVSSYFAMRRYVLEEVLKYENSYPYLIGLVLRTTTNIVNVTVNHRKREVGTSGYTLGKLIGLWMNGFTAFSIKPLRIATAIGTTAAICGFLYGIYTIIKKLVNPAVPVGFSALMSAIVFFGGMTILMVGMAGEYIGRTYISVNNAPQYVVRETTGKGVDDRS